MATLNRVGLTYARSLINAGNVDKTSAWSFSADDGNKLLGDNGDDWANYGKHHLGVDTGAAENTKDRYKYPFAKNGTAYRSAFAAIRQRAGQQNDTEVFDAAGRCTEMIDGASDSQTNSAVSAQRERRFAGVPECRAENGSVRVRGHAAVFNQEADIGGYFRELIKPGAFTNAIREDDIPFLIEHEGLPLARNSSGTLALSEDARGLLIESQLDSADPDVQRIVPKMQRGDLNKMSFAFQATRQEWDETGDIPLRIIHECRLFDVSIVTSPAYVGTDIGMRSLAEWRQAHAPVINRTPIIGARLRMRHALRTRELAR